MPHYLFIGLCSFGEFVECGLSWFKTMYGRFWESFAVGLSSFSYMRTQIKDSPNGSILQQVLLCCKYIRLVAIHEEVVCKHQ